MRTAVGEVWSLAWPTVVTMTSYTVMQFADSLMVAKVGALEMAAQGNGSIWSFTVIAFLFGIVTMVNTFVAQSLGAERPRDVARYAWAGIWFSVLAWLVLLLPFAAVLPSLFARMGHEPRLVELETKYAVILLSCGVITLGGKALSNVFFGLHRPKVIAVAAIVGNVVNLAGNYTLIYGSAGLPSLGLPGIPGVPALGVPGAAIATMIGTAVECSIPLAIFLGPKLNERFGIRRAWRLDRSAIGDLLRVGWPNALQFGNEIVCWAIFMTVLVGTFGTLHLAAGWSVLRYMHLSFMPAVGFSVAVASLVGRYIGAGDPDRAANRARVGVAMALLYMTGCAILMFSFRGALLRVFAENGSSDPAAVGEIVRIGSLMMICAAIFQTFDAIGIVYSGALRGAGDTVVPGVATIVLSWALIVGFGKFLVDYASGLASMGPWIAASIYIISIGFFMAGRFESGRWRRIRLLRPQTSGEAS